MDKTKSLLPAIIISIGIVILGFFIYLGYQSQEQSQTGTEMGAALSKDEAKEVAMDFINNMMLQGQSLATFVSIVEERGMYKVDILVAGNPFSSYITKDGKVFFPEGIVIDEFSPDQWMIPQGTEIDQDLLPQF